MVAESLVISIASGWLVSRTMQRSMAGLKSVDLAAAIGKPSVAYYALPQPLN